LNVTATLPIKYKEEFFAAS